VPRSGPERGLESLAPNPPLPGAYPAVVAFDEGLAERIRDHVADDLLMSERKMFGGLCFMSSGNMCFGVIGSDLLVRVGPESYAASLTLAHVREMDLTGRPMRGMVLVDSERLSEDDSLRGWLDRGLDFTDTLPPKVT
jgi:hypothetical protein